MADLTFTLKDGFRTVCRNVSHNQQQSSGLHKPRESTKRQTKFIVLRIFFFLSVIGCIAYFLFGFAFAFGEPGNLFIGTNYFALANLPPALFSKWFFQFVFAATAATIVSGAMAERTDFVAYISYSVFLTGTDMISICGLC